MNLIVNGIMFSHKQSLCVSLVCIVTTAFSETLIVIVAFCVHIDTHIAIPIITKLVLPCTYHVYAFLTIILMLNDNKYCLVCIYSVVNKD